MQIENIEQTTCLHVSYPLVLSNYPFLHRFSTVWRALPRCAVPAKPQSPQRWDNSSSITALNHSHRATSIPGTTKYIRTRISPIRYLTTESTYILKIRFVSLKCRAQVVSQHAQPATQKASRTASTAEDMAPTSALIAGWGRVDVYR